MPSAGPDLSAGPLTFLSAQAWPLPDRHEKKTMSKKGTCTGGKNSLIQEIYWSGMLCPIPGCMVVFKPCIFNRIKVRNGCYQLVGTNISLRINGCLVAEPNSVQRCSLL